MECVAGATAFGATGVYRYNRDNFFYDRKLRLRAEFKLQEFRVDQAKLWREDIRDLISLSEYKMHVYLLVNVLLLGLVVVIWCQGKLPWNTPDWLMAGEVISTAGAMMFLLLSIWMAMHAAVAAQSYETRLLTQLVRLPIPTWHEVEGCRTTASDFEKLTAGQMFRVPWAMGWQERRVPTTAAGDTAAGRAPPLDTASTTTVSASGAEEEEEEPLAAATAGGQPVSSDPWGLERSGDDLADLGVKMGADVARLRHVKIARQAMIHWQSYDAFARISMSVGVNQLLLAMSYYILGYVLVEVGTRDAAACGVLVLTVISATLLRLDMSLSAGQLRLLQGVQGLGPLASTTAAYWWAENTHGSSRIAEACSVVAFFAHSSFIAMMTIFARVEPVGEVVVLPRAFSSVLYLDVFGWVRSQAEGMAAADLRAHGDGDDGSPAARQSRPGSLPMQRGLGDTGAPHRPEDLKLEDAVQDMSGLPGAPAGLSQSANPRERDQSFFLDADSWLAMDAVEEAVTGHGGESPRIVPWHIFRNSAWSLCAAWFAAASYHLVSVWSGWNFQASAVLEEAFAQVSMGGMTRSAMLLQPGRSDVSWRMSLEEVHTSWPVDAAHVRTLACDPTGERFLASDGLFVLAADVVRDAQQGLQTRAAFERLDCPMLEGEGVQDAMVACRRAGGCDGLALHRHGRRLSACALRPSSASAVVAISGAFEANVSDTWLERLREAASETLRGSAPHARFEKVVAITRDADCREEGTSPPTAQRPWEPCLLLGTTHGRVVQAVSRSEPGRRAPLVVPSEVLASGRALGELRPGSMRAFGDTKVGALQEDGRMILLLDTARGAVAARLVLPEHLAASSFCAGGGFVYLLGRGSNPKIWRFRAPKELWAAGRFSSPAAS